MKLPFVIKIFVLSIFEWPLKTGFTVFVSVGTLILHINVLAYFIVCFDFVRLQINVSFLKDNKKLRNKQITENSFNYSVVLNCWEYRFSGEQN